VHGLPARLSWIDLHVFGDEEAPKEPIHRRGIVAGEPGLYFVGLFFLYAMSSGFLPGVGRDAEHVAEHIAWRQQNCHPTALARSATP
jgi:putative flavoprotein involved in K+ transport